MSNTETDNYAFVGSPVKLSGTAQSVHAFLLHRFDLRTHLANGRPNKGYRKSYPSMDEMQTWCAGMSRQSVSRAIEELIAKGLIIRVEIGRPGQRANYVPIYVLALVGDYVNHALHKAKNYTKVTVSDNVEIALSKQSLQNVSSEVYTISNESNKNSNRNKNRFSDFKLLLLPHLQCIEPGPNVEIALEDLASKGCTLQVPARLLNDHDYTDAKSVSDVAVKLLTEFSKSYAPTYQPPAYVAEPVNLNPAPAGLLDDLRRTIGKGTTEPI